MDENQLADINSTTNDEEVVIEQETVEEPKKSNSNSNVAKLLKQRNEYKSKIEELERKSTEEGNLAKEVAELKELVAKQALDNDAKAEKSDYFNKNPNAKDFEAEMDQLVSGKGLTLDEAFRLVAAERNPALLLDEQTRNKQYSNQNLGGVPKTEVKKDFSELTKDDIRNGIISENEFLKMSNELAAKDRQNNGLLR